MPTIDSPVLNVLIPVELLFPAPTFPRLIVLPFLVVRVKPATPSPGKVDVKPSNETTASPACSPGGESHLSALFLALHRAVCPSTSFTAQLAKLN